MTSGVAPAHVWQYEALPDQWVCASYWRGDAVEAVSPPLGELWSSGCPLVIYPPHGVF